VDVCHCVWCFKVLDSILYFVQSLLTQFLQITQWKRRWSYWCKMQKGGSAPQTLSDGGSCDRVVLAVLALPTVPDTLQFHYGILHLDEESWHMRRMRCKAWLSSECECEPPDVNVRAAPRFTIDSTSSFFFGRCLRILAGNILCGQGKDGLEGEHAARG
jgi:hypothetical protein